MRRRVLRIARTLLGSRYAAVRNRLLGEPVPTALSKQVRVLQDSGLFDRDYYVAAAGLGEMTERSAARHFVSEGSLKGLSPHPLIEPEYMPWELKNAIERGEVDKLVQHLESEDSQNHAWGPLYDPRSLNQRQGDESSLGPLERLRRLAPDTELPVDEHFVGPAPRWEAVRTHQVQHVRDVHRQRSFRAATTTPNWDERRERSWIKEMDGRARLPEGAMVSVVMPVWNRRELLHVAIESVRAQSFQNWELIIVDDGSTDGTIEVVQEYATRDPRIVVIAQGHHGVCAARNAGLGAARGDYLAFLDSDNSWSPRFLELALKGLNAGGHDFVYAGLRSTGTSGDIRYRGMQVDLHDLRVGNSIDMNCVLVRTDLVRDIGGFDNKLRRWVDYDLVLRLAEITSPVYLPFVGCFYTNNDEVDRITTKESAHWQYVVLEKSVVDWSAAEAALAQRVPGRVSIVMNTYQDHRRTTAAVDQILSTTGELDVEVVLVDNGSRPAVGRVLSARFSTNPRVRYMRLVRNYFFAIGSNYGFTRSTGEFVLFLNNDIDPRGDWLTPLLDRLRSTGAFAVQPVLTELNGAVQSAGLLCAVEGGLPVPFLAGHPVQDARKHDGVGFHAVSAAAMLIRADDFQRLNGFDPIFANGYEDIDFCFRAAQEAEVSFGVETSSTIVHEGGATPGRHDRSDENRRLLLERWSGRLPAPRQEQYEKLGFSVPHTVPGEGDDIASARPLPIRQPRMTELGGRVIPSLRWSIKIGADNSRSGDLWGDVPFADDLRDSLQKLGQEVVIDRFGAFNRPTSYLDDVVLAIRGRHPIPPQPGRFNILWVISRPDMVTVEELRGYQMVFAASPIWAEWMARMSRRKIHVLLQATNPMRFNDSVPLQENSDQVVFVGGPRMANGRQIVSDALAAEITLGVWGPGWKQFVPESFVRGRYVGPNEVPSVYRSATIVLNDHLPEMAMWGFVSNRVFDVVACGSVVISDSISGLDEFGGAVRSYGSVEELRELVRDSSWRPSVEQMQSIAARVRAEHSFDRRAETLLDAVLTSAEA